MQKSKYTVLDDPTLNYWTKTLNIYVTKFTDLSNSS